MDDADGDDEWRFGLDDVGEDGEDPLVPGDIDPENAVFFLLGVAFAVVALAAMVV